MSKPVILVSIQFTLFVIIGVSVFLFPTEHSTVQWIFGGGGVLLGLAIALWAIAEHSRVNRKGPSALPTPNPQVGLITTGLYRYVRHPIYTGVLLAAFGVTIWHGHAVTLIASLFLVGLLTYKSLYEDELLTKQYPTYKQYRQTTGRFLPKLK